jgi:SAM-dependent methyltransferase
MTTPGWLPDKRYYEYINHKIRVPGVEWNTWRPWDEWTYPDEVIVWLSHLIEKQIPHMRNRRVLDAGCAQGFVSLFCLHNDASHVTGLDVRDIPLELAREVTKLAGYSNCTFKVGDIQGPEFRELCDDHDTVLISGTLQYLTDHYSVLRTIAESNAQTVILNSCTSPISKDSQPVVEWSLKPTTQIEEADYNQPYHPTHTELFLGQPNQKWTEQALLSLGFKITYSEIWQYGPWIHYVLTGTKS